MFCSSLAVRYVTVLATMLVLVTTNSVNAQMLSMGSTSAPTRAPTTSPGCYGVPDPLSCVSLMQYCDSTGLSFTVLAAIRAQCPGSCGTCPSTTATTTMTSSATSTPTTTQTTFSPTAVPSPASTNPPTASPTPFPNCYGDPDPADCVTLGLLCNSTTIDPALLAQIRNECPGHCGTCPSTTATTTVTTSQTSTDTTSITSTKTTSMTSTQTTSGTSSPTTTQTTSQTSSQTTSATSSQTTSVSTTATSSVTSSQTTSVTTSATTTVTSSITTTATTTATTSVTTTETTLPFGRFECIDAGSLLYIGVPETVDCEFQAGVLNEILDVCPGPSGNVTCEQLGTYHFLVDTITGDSCDATATALESAILEAEGPGYFGQNHSIGCTLFRYFHFTSRAGNTTEAEACTDSAISLNSLVNMYLDGDFEDCQRTTPTTSVTSTGTSTGTTTATTTQTTTLTTTATTSQTTSMTTSATTSQTTTLTTTPTTSVTSTVTTSATSTLTTSPTTTVTSSQTTSQTTTATTTAGDSSFTCVQKFGTTYLSVVGGEKCPRQARALTELLSSCPTAPRDDATCNEVDGDILLTSTTACSNLSSSINFAVNNHRGPEYIRGQRLNSSVAGAAGPVNVSDVAECVDRCFRSTSCVAASAFDDNFTTADGDIINTLICFTFSNEETLQILELDDDMQDGDIWMRAGNLSETVGCAFNHLYDTQDDLEQCLILAGDLNEMVNAHLAGGFTSCGVTDAPTAAPTLSPTLAPTARPTMTPTPSGGFQPLSGEETTGMFGSAGGVSAVIIPVLIVLLLVVVVVWRRKSKAEDQQRCDDTVSDSSSTGSSAWARHKAKSEFAVNPMYTTPTDVHRGDMLDTSTIASEGTMGPEYADVDDGKGTLHATPLESPYVPAHAQCTEPVVYDVTEHVQWRDQTAEGIHGYDYRSLPKVVARDTGPRARSNDAQECTAETMSLRSGDIMGGYLDMTGGAGDRENSDVSDCDDKWQGDGGAVLPPLDLTYESSPATLDNKALDPLYDDCDDTAALGSLYDADYESAVDVDDTGVGGEREFVPSSIPPRQESWRNMLRPQRRSSFSEHRVGSTQS
eukprot:m.1180052 g.1180052  ORF g.1180052 m.1180052 type:complete len:1087 (+) comp24531_c0_seq1:511-3771(+)